MSWGQKKHTDAIMRAKYAEMKAREGPMEDGRPMSTTIGLPSGAPQVEQRAPTSASLVGNTMNIVRATAANPHPPTARPPARRKAARPVFVSTAAAVPRGSGLLVLSLSRNRC